MFHSHLSMKFCGESILMATHIINRLLSRILYWKSPYELLYQEKPDLLRLKVFGCLTCSTITRPPQDKFGPRAIKGVFLGHVVGEKFYKLYDLQKNIIYSSRDVRFYEDHFSFSADINVHDDGVLPTPIFENMDTTSDIVAPIPIATTILTSEPHTSISSSDSNLP